jgi:hypothetical protein
MPEICRGVITQLAEAKQCLELGIVHIYTFSRNFYLIYGILWNKVLIVAYVVSIGCSYWCLNPEDWNMTLHCCEIFTFPFFLNKKFISGLKTGPHLSLP